MPQTDSQSPPPYNTYLFRCSRTCLTHSPGYPVLIPRPTYLFLFMLFWVREQDTHDTVMLKILLISIWTGIWKWGYPAPSSIFYAKVKREHPVFQLTGIALLFHISSQELLHCMYAMRVSMGSCR